MSYCPIVSMEVICTGCFCVTMVTIVWREWVEVGVLRMSLPNQGHLCRCFSSPVPACLKGGKLCL